VIDLDYSGPRCVLRVLRRMLRGVRRDEMPVGCVDRFQWHVLGWVLWKKERPFIDDALRAAKMKTYLRFTTPAQADAWLAVR